MTIVVLVRMIKKDHLHGVGFLFHRTLPIIHHRLGVDVLDPPVDGRQQVEDDPKRGNSGGDPKEVAHVTGGVAGIHGGIPLPHGSAGR